MIVKMKKITLLCLETERTQTLKALRDLGVMHIQPVVPPSGGHLETAKKRAATLQRLLTALPKVKNAAPTGRTPRDVFQAVEELLELKRQNQDRMDALKTEIGRMEPFGSFSPEAIQDLKQ